MQSIQRYCFPRNRFYDLGSLQTRSASVGVHSNWKIKNPTWAKIRALGSVSVCCVRIISSSFSSFENLVSFWNTVDFDVSFTFDLRLESLKKKLGKIFVEKKHSFSNESSFFLSLALNCSALHLTRFLMLARLTIN